MTKYPSIETVYKRDKETNTLEWGVLREREVQYVTEWDLSEKIDGTNIRVTYYLKEGAPMIDIKGRTDNAQLTDEMRKAVRKAFPQAQEGQQFEHSTVFDYFTEYRGKELPPEWTVTFYGELYGPGIQKGGVYANEKKFRCFDLKLGEELWVADPEMRRVCSDLEIPMAPYLGRHIIMAWPRTKDDVLNLFPKTQEGSGYSVVAWDDKSEIIEPEGIVAKPPVVLLNAKRERVMWKLTLREFK